MNPELPITSFISGVVHKGRVRNVIVCICTTSTTQSSSVLTGTFAICCNASINKCQ